MKNVLKRTLVAMVAVAMLAALIPGKAQAKDDENLYTYKITEMAQKQWTTAGKFTAKKGDDGKWVFTINALKIDVPSNGYAKIETKDANTKVFMSTGLKEGAKVTEFVYDYGLTGSTTYCRVFPQGTYYLWTAEEKDVSLKYTFVKASSPDNYCRAKAAKLNSGKKQTIVFTDGYEYSRWYKIKLNKKKAITLNLNAVDGGEIEKYFGVFDSKGKAVSVTAKTKNKTYKTATLKKGTYYVRIDYPFTWSEPGSAYARIKEFSWK
jgi:hypothetical protein